MSSIEDLFEEIFDSISDLENELSGAYDEFEHCKINVYDGMAALDEALSRMSEFTNALNQLRDKVNALDKKAEANEKEAFLASLDKKHEETAASSSNT